MHRNRLGKISPKSERIRLAIQLVSTAVLNGYAEGFAKGRIFMGSTKAVCVPVLNCYSCPGALGSCPIGALQTALGGEGRHFPFYVLGMLMLFGVLLGRLVCGFLCPFGLVQDLLHRIPVPKVQVPASVHNVLRYAKYFVLAFLVVLLPIAVTDEFGTTPPFYCEWICPAGTLGAGIPLVVSDPMLGNLVGVLFDWKLLVLVIVIIASTCIYRPFCKYLCPLGAFYSLFNKYGFYRQSVDAHACTGCGACRHACPMGVSPNESPNSLECIRCGRCRAACPEDALKAGFAWSYTPDFDPEAGHPKL